jgi:RNA polymerase sigma-70 factor, ECF subfamily
VSKHDQALGEQNNEAVAQLAAQGDHAAFTLLYQRTVKPVYAYCYSQVGTIEDAQDLTTQTFMAAWEQMARYRGEGTVAAWLMGIAYHKVRDWQRKQRFMAPLATVESLPDPAPLPDALVFQQWQRVALEQALQSLTPERAQAIALRFFGELSHAEVAAVMDKQEAAVKMLVHRGLQELRLRLGANKERVL